MYIKFKKRTATYIFKLSDKSIFLIIETPPSVKIAKYHLKAIIFPYFRIININQSSQTDFERITFYDGDDSIEQAGDKNSNVRNRFSIFVKR